MSWSTSASFGSRFTAAVCLLIAATLATAHQARAQARRPIQANDLYRIRTARDVVISPDGERVAFVVTQIDSAADAYYSHLWLAGVNDRQVRQLTRGAVRDRDPAWSPDGSKIAFVSNRGGEAAQIFVLPLDGGEPWALTDLENGASNPVWSPDGRTLLFISSLTTAELEEATPAETDAAGEGEGEDTDEAAMWGSLAAIRNWLAQNAAREQPAVITRLRFLGERGLNPIERWDHIYAIDLENGEPRRLTDGPYDFSAPSFSPDGRQIAFIGDITNGVHPDYSLKNELYIMDVAGDVPRMIDIPGYSVSRPSWSPDGTHIAFAARDTTEPSAANTIIGVLELVDRGLVGDVEWVSRALDRSARQYRWSADGSSIYFSAGVHGTVPIYRVPLHDGQIRQVVSGERGVLSFDLVGDKLAFTVTQPANPSEVYMANAAGDDERRLTDLNTAWLSDIFVQPHRGFWYQSFDGRRVQGWLIEPVGYHGNEKYPLAVEIHGGPHSMWGPGEQTMWHEFQLLAANGYFVLYTNPRGSSGYGYDFKYLIQRAWGDGPMRDVLTAVDTIVARGLVDEARMVVTGGSYAGYLTAYIVGHDRRFAAAVAQRGVYDLATFFGEGNAWRLVPFEFNAYPWEDPEVLRRESPISYAHLIETPLLIIHSDRDLRTGVSQSEMLYRTLKVLKKPVEYVRYPREGHELSRSGEPLLRVDRLLRILEFFQRYVRPDL
ncbi:MAG: S9 family peptidase [Gemmatimonadales bacterium]|jgi:dipeptidyl aminopeptidase/acylaminoacyl peptidase